MLHVLLRLAHGGVEVEFQLRQHVNTLKPELFYTVSLLQLGISCLNLQAFDFDI